MLNFELIIENSDANLPSDYQIKLAWSGRFYRVFSSRGWEASFHDLCDARLFINALEIRDQNEK